MILKLEARLLFMEARLEARGWKLEAGKSTFGGTIPLSHPASRFQYPYQLPQP